MLRMVGMSMHRFEHAVARVNFGLIGKSNDWNTRDPSKDRSSRSLPFEPFVTRERVSRIVWVTGERLKSRSFRPLSLNLRFSLQLRAHVETDSYSHATVMVVIDWGALIEIREILSIDVESSDSSFTRVSGI